MARELSKKLGLKPGQTVLLIHPAPSAARRLRAEVPPGVRFIRSAGGRSVDQIFLWPLTVRGLAAQLARLQRRLAPEGSVWIMIPKKPFAAARGIRFTWEEMQAEALKGDFVDNKVATFDDQDYGTRFVVRRARRGSKH